MERKNVVITGASSGIGRAIAELFITKKHNVINLDIVDCQNDEVDYIAVDLSNVSDISNAFSKVEKKYKTIDVLISNAGIHYSNNIENTSKDDYFKVLNTNLTSTFFSIKHTIPMMKKNGGRIITISSDQSVIAKQNSAIYGCSKAAIMQLTKNIALDYVKYGIFANCISTGTIDTKLYRDAINNYCERSGANFDDVHREEENMQPIHRLGKVEEVASLAYYLSVEAGSYILGSNIVMDGGYSIR